MNDLTKDNSTAERPYFLEAHDTCPKCGVLGWDIIGPDGAALGQWFEDEEHAEDFCESLNDAYESGRASLLAEREKPASTGASNA